MRLVDASWPAADRAGFIAAIASAGPTFQPGLLPRHAIDQTVATGVVSALNHGIVTTSQSGVRALLRWVAPARGQVSGPDPELLAALVGVGTGLTGWVFGARACGGPTLATLGRRLARSSSIGLVAVGADKLAERLPFSVPPWLSPSRRPLAALAGTALAARHIHRWRGSALAGPDGAAPPAEVIRSAALGAGLSIGLIGLNRLEQAAVRCLTDMLASVLPPGRTNRDLAAALANAVVLATTAAAAHAYIHRSALASQAESTRVEPGFAQPPNHAAVSGGPRSQVTFATLSMEGRRFVNRVTPVDEIARVMGGCRAAPVRVYVGLQSAATAIARVEQALAELETLGAFDRGTLCLAVPAGTGFVNPVATAALEYVTGGDCATVAVQYSLRRSYYSLDRVALSAEQNRLLLTALAERLQTRRPDERPRLVLYGESLGALAAQLSLSGNGVAALDRAGIDRALYAGTPSSAPWTRRWRDDPDRVDPDGHIVEVASFDEWQHLPTERRKRARVVLLSHHDDPVTIFDRGLLVKPAQARSLTAQARWRPLTSYVHTAIDLKNAMGSGATEFTTVGHDYRGDLARFVVLAYGFDVNDETVDRVDAAIRSRAIDPG